MWLGDRDCTTCVFYGNYPTEKQVYNHVTQDYETQIVNKMSCKFGLNRAYSRTCLYYVKNTGRS